MESTILERICLSNIDLRLRMDRSHLLFPFRATDRFLASYPRSGNTWARSVVSYIMAKITNDPEVESFNRLVKYTPDIYLGNCDQCPDPRIIKTHSHYMPHFATFRGVFTLFETAGILLFRTTIIVSWLTIVITRSASVIS